MSWSYSFHKRAQRQFLDLPSDVQDEILTTLEQFLKNPAASDIKKIKTAKPPYWR